MLLGPFQSMSGEIHNQKNIHVFEDPNAVLKNQGGIKDCENNNIMRCEKRREVVSAASNRNIMVTQNLADVCNGTSNIKTTKLNKKNIN